MTFLTYDDITAKVPITILNQITDSIDAVLDQAEQQAIAFVRDSLTNKYDLDAELQKTGADRHPSLVRWLTDLVIYYIYNRVPDLQIPDRVWKNYDDTRKELTDISSGRRQTTLTPVYTDDSKTQTNTYFRYDTRGNKSYSPF